MARQVRVCIQQHHILQPLQEKLKALEGKVCPVALSTPVSAPPRPHPPRESGGRTSSGRTRARPDVQRGEMYGVLRGRRGLLEEGEQVWVQQPVETGGLQGARAKF